MRWSRLRQLIEELFAPGLDLQIHCTSFRSTLGPPIGRYWLVLDGETIWDAPKDLSRDLAAGAENDVAPQITALLRDYLETSRDNLLAQSFARDRWGLMPILKVADRRVGKRVLDTIPEGSLSEAAEKVRRARKARVIESTPKKESERD